MARKPQFSTFSDDPLIFAEEARRAALQTEGVTATAIQDIPHPFWLVSALLWQQTVRFDPESPLWPDRDRFFVSSSRLLPLRNAFLNLVSSSAPSSAATELFGLAGALPGQAIAAACGMTLAEKILARRFGRSLVDHRTWLLALPGDLETGVALEAAALADRFHLDRLTIIVASATSAPEEKADLSLALDRIEASGWSIRRLDGDDANAIAQALAATPRARKPRLILCETSGKTTPPPRPSRAKDTAKDSTQPDVSAPEIIPSDTRRRGSVQRSWLRRLTRHPLRAEFERTLERRTPARLEDDFLRHAGESLPVEHEGGGSDTSLLHFGVKARERLADLLPEFVAMSAGHAPKSVGVSPGEAGFFVCGPREPAMVGFMNGLALHGSILPCGTANLSSADRIRPALRFAALSRERLLLVLIEDDPEASTCPPWQQVEQLASLRAMPNLALFRPADSHEVAAAWLSALSWRHGPAVIVLARQGSPASGQNTSPAPADTATPPIRKTEQGGYVLREAKGGPTHRAVTLIASGPEVGLALQAQHRLEKEGVPAAVVSLPCWELFEKQGAPYRRSVLGQCPRVAIEAASGFGWERWLGDTGIFIGSEEFGVASGFDPLYQSSGLTPDVVCTRVRALLGVTQKQEDRARTETQKRGGDPRLRPSPIVKSNHRPGPGR
ncbi:transketolase-like TK C-terminal-containing protein [Acetobacter sp.]|jgi:transketolase|uniref:transketolase-like TK C-terminal-containing protein n=1 Tax=Acetobacter sp. TaxID=440 RepID=UPI0025C42623|nr:transketolase C-terminal domain-containing protein [Acetobacter sp.]MCH4089679.1 transketolase [Acetobacter sp.]MCI1300659.1 transketolase [Acetobacter sp.]MCI1317053.1 transketolase [Acetobacter sp.]